MKNLYYFLFLILLAAPLGAAAQTARLYTSETGLPNSQVNRISQDRNGYIWLCSEGGLIRFDGMRFETYRHDRENANSLSSSSVLDMLEDRLGTTWVGTANGLNVFDSEHASFSLFELPNSQTGAASPYIGRLLEVPGRNGESSLYVATGGSGVFVIDCRTHELLSGQREQIYRHVHSDHLHTLYLDSARRLWIVPGDGLPVILDADSLEPVPGLGWSPELLREADQMRVNDLAEDPLTGKILLCGSQGLLVAGTDSGIIRKARGKQAAATIGASVIFNSQTAPGEGRSFLIGDENGGLLLFDPDTEEIRPAALSSIRSDTERWKATSVTEDSQGNLWMGLYQTGVLVAPRSMYGFSYLGFSSRGIPGENSACIMSVYEDGQDLWVATDGAGLFRRPLDGRSRERVFNRENSALTNNAVMAVAGDRHGTIWIGTYLDGLYYLEGGTVMKKFADNDKIGTPRIRTLAYDADRDLLYVGTYGAGLAIIDPRTRRLAGQKVSEDYRWVSTLHLDASGLLWVGTYNGPHCYDPAADRIVPYKLPGGSDIPLRIYAVSSSPDGNVWFGTEEGVFRVDESSRQVWRYTEQDGLANNVIRDILCAAGGEMWISTSSGLSRLSPATGKITSYRASDGLQGNEFRSGAAFRAASGRLYFGGNGGLTVFSPRLIDNSSRRIPQVTLARLTVLDRDVVYDPAAGNGNLIDKHISEATRITIPRGSDLFSVEFSVPEYTNPQRIVYAYRLRGFDPDWKTAPARLRMASYTNVPPGRYRFEVKAYFADAPEESSEHAVDLRVEAPWFRSGGAYVFYLILLCGLAMLLRNTVRERRRRETEKKEAELKELRLGLFTNLTHEIRTPLTLVMGPLRTLREAEQDPEQKDTYNLMYRNCLRINRIVDQVMDLRKIDAGQMPMHFRETDLVYFVKDIMQSFLNLAHSKRISFGIDAARPEETVWIDQGNFDKIVYNILSNAFKHTPDGGRIRLGISAPQPNRGELRPDIREYVEVRIFNSGSRIEDAYINRIFDRFVQVDPHDANTGSGVGLNLTKMLVELHHGRIRVGNEDDGVAFRVLVPVGKDHLTAEELSATTHHKDLYVKGREIRFDSHEDETFATPATDGDKAVKALRTIFLVEDDDETREYLKARLRTRYNVVACASALEAWPLIGEKAPDAVLTDLVMPQMSGSELCAEIRRNESTRHIPVIILTGQDGEQEAQAAADSGADKFLSKPISVELLLSSIAQVISAREAVKDKFGVAMNFDYSGIKMGSADEKLMRRVTESIQTHLEDPAFDVTALCTDVGISRVHLNRKLKEYGKEPPSALIKRCRMKQAAWLLAGNRVNVSEVAYRVGFSSHSYFSSSFRDFFGMSPREFVARLEENPDDETLKKLLE